MPPTSTEEIGRNLHETGLLAEFERAISQDDSLQVVAILQRCGVDDEIITRMILQLDKDYLLALAEAGRTAAAG